MPNSSGILYLRAQTGLHPGAGSSVGAIDLPIQRERHTGWPCIQGSSVKGVLREAYRLHMHRTGKAAAPADDDDGRRTWRDIADLTDELTAIFGKAEGDTGYAGAIAVTDARVLAFPVRSAKGVYALLTCPAVVQRYLEDLAMAGMSHRTIQLPNLADDRVLVSDVGLAALSVQLAQRQSIILEDLVFEQGDGSSSALDELAKVFAAVGVPNVYQRLVVVSDNAFGHFVNHCTEIVTRIALDSDTKRVRTGALFVLEMLPAESVFYSALLGAQDRAEPAGDHTAVAQIKGALAVTKLLQVGGEETTGKGWCWAQVEVAE
ncbi:MAG TPA: type III-B CRISPR module RAMP protein Cmr4 [Chthonomonadales bacterium]|nr:type III-B CRISPR module RAMP protein Cmr4 [Chthonomonadales bacterium]